MKRIAFILLIAVTSCSHGPRVNHCYWLTDPTLNEQVALDESKSLPIKITSLGDFGVGFKLFYEPKGRNKHYASHKYVDLNLGPQIDCDTIEEIYNGEK